MFSQHKEVNMKLFFKLFYTSLLLILTMVISVAIQAKVVGNKIILGSAISFTGKYSANGIHASNGYNLGVKRVNEMGGVKVGGKTYQLEIKYYDDESTPARGAQLAERLTANSFADKAFFCNSGGEAVEAALKMARIR